MGAKPKQFSAPFSHLLFWIAALVWARPLPAHAADASFNPEEFQDAANLIAGQALQAVVKTVGLSGEFRPTRGALPPGGVTGLDVGLSAQVSQAPTEFTDALVSAGYKKPPFTSVPAAHLQAHVRLASFWSVGVGFLKYKEFKLQGATTQFSWAADEGPVFALRITYSKNELGFVKTETYAPMFLISKPLAFFEPYIGIGPTWTNGTVTVPLTVSGQSVTISGDAHTGAMTFLGGLTMNLSALQITVEGDYSSADITSLGAKVGLRL